MTVKTGYCLRGLPGEPQFHERCPGGFTDTTSRAQPRWVACSCECGHKGVRKECTSSE